MALIWLYRCEPYELSRCSSLLVEIQLCYSTALAVQMRAIWNFLIWLTSDRDVAVLWHSSIITDMGLIWVIIHSLMWSKGQLCIYGPNLGHLELPYELKILLFAVCGLQINPVLIPDDILVILQCSCHGIAYTWFQKFEPASKNCFYLMMY